MQTEILETRLAPASLTGGVTVVAADINRDGYPDLIAASGPGSAPEIKVFSGKEGTLRFDFYAFDNSVSGGVSLAVGDVDGDGTPDIVVGAGPGSAPEVRVFSGKDGSPLRDFYAYDGAFTGGVSVAAADFNGDGSADIVTGAGPGGAPHVRIFNGLDGTLLHEFLAYDPTSHGGVHVGVGDVNHDGTPDLITGTGPGAGPEVKVFSGKDWTPVYDFYAYDASVTGGVFVAGGDVSGDGFDDIITGSGPGTAARVRVFSGADASLYRDFYAYAGNFLGGVWVADPDFNGDGHHDIATGAGPTGGPHVRVFSGEDGAELASFYAFGPNSGTGPFSQPAGTVDTQPPNLAITSPASNLVTNLNPTLVGQVTDAGSGVALLEEQVDGGPFASVSFDGLGNFSFTTSLALNGTADGIHTVHFKAIDRAGNVATTDWSFTLDTVPPTQPVMELSVADEAGPAEPDTSTGGRVTLVGQTDPGIPVALVGTGLQTRASDTGSFQFPDVPLNPGPNPFTARATDAAGNTSDFTLTVTRTASTNQPNAIIVWNQAALNAIEQDGTDPLFASRGLAMVQAAVFDAVNAIDGTPAYYVKVTAPADASVDAAVDAAAHDVLGYLYPAQHAAFDALFAAQLALLPANQATTDGETVGQAAGNAIVALRANDGSRNFVDFTTGTATGDWQLTPPAYAEPLDPQWANLTPFALTSPDQFRPAGPPDLTSQQWADAVNQVESLGRATGSTRTADQTQIAQFWNDGGGTFTPPGHWNAIAETVAQQQGDSLASDARLFAELDVALADAGITAWNTKYFYDTWRPITVIQGGGDGVNPDVTADPTWYPFLTTPNFPEYVSGHSTFSAAAATVLDAFFGGNVPFTSTEETLPNVVRSFTSFDQAAQEAGLSRIYGGIHFSFSNTDGQAAGTAVAHYVLGTFDISQDTTPPRVTLDKVLASGASPTNITITGQATDTLSGVKLVEVQVDQGSYAALPVDPLTGKFAFTTSFALDGSANGAHTINFRATDAAGNVAAPVAFTFTLGTAPPVLSLTTPTDGATLVLGNTLAGTATTSGPALVALHYAFDGATNMPVPFNTDGSFSQALDLSKLAKGDHQLTITAIDAAGNTTTQLLHVHMDAAIPLMVSSVTPMDGATDVGVTFRPKVTFSRAIDPSTLTSSDFYATDSAGDKLPATIVPSDDGTYAWLFFSNPMPGGSTITLTVDGSVIKAADGSVLDAAMNGTPGSKLTETFTTVSVATVAGTSLSGIVADPGPDLKPMTRDDVRNGPDNVLGTADDVYLHPIAGATVYILGLQDQAVVTDAQGRFHFDVIPAGDVKLVIDGTTAINAPDGYYFPQMTMDLTIKPGVANTVMGSMGTTQEQAANATAQGVYLPRLLKSILKPVSPTGITHISEDPTSAPDLTPQQQQSLSMDVKAGSLVDENGQRVANAQIGISVVPPQLVMDMLPPGVLQHTVDITIQAPGAVAFTTPATLTFPNIFGAAPGTQLNFLSFDHTTGRLEIDGTATVSADGLSVTTDPGQGITHVGWHGLTPAGTPTGDPCPASAVATVNVPARLVTAPDPLHSYFFTNDTGAFTLSFGNVANKLDGTAAGSGTDPCSPVNMQATPLVVDITVDATASQFLDGLHTQTFALLPGQDTRIRVTVKSLTALEDAASGGGAPVIFQQDQFYATKIHIRAYTAFQSSDLLDKDIYVYRFVDIADDNSSDGVVDFPDTTPGVGRVRDITTHWVAGAAPVLSLNDNTNFSDRALTFSPPAFGFRPTQLGKDLTATVRVVTPDGESVGSLSLRGTAKVQEWYVNTTAFDAELQRIANNDPNLTLPEKLLIDTPEKRQQVINAVLDRVQNVLFADFGSALVRVTTPHPAAIQINSFTTPPTITTAFAAAVSGIDAIGPTLQFLLATRSLLPAAEQDYILSKALNQNPAGTIEMYLANTFDDYIKDFHYAIFSMADLVNQLANTVAHELGHTLGLFHVNANGKEMNGTELAYLTDLMTYFADPAGIGRFNVTHGAVQVALGAAWTNDDAQSALDYYGQYYALGGNYRDIRDPAADAPSSAAGDPDAGNLPPFNGAVPWIVTEPNNTFINSSLDLGRVTADGSQSLTQTFVVRNIGNQPLLVNDLEVIGGPPSLTVSAIAPGTTVAPRGELPFTVTFQPMSGGVVSARLLLHSNGLGGTYKINLTATAVSPTGELSVSVPDNNLGGASVGGPSAVVTQFATLTNSGAAPLRIGDVHTTSGEFTLTGLPAGFGPGSPLVLAPGQSYTIGLTYRPSAIGLQRGEVDIASDDPHHASTSITVVGTGLSASGTALQDGNDYVAIGNLDNPAAPVIRQLSSTSGNWSVFLPANTRIHYAIFDPVSGLLAAGDAVSAASGQVTRLPQPIFQPSTAPDSDGDGLPDDVEFAIGTDPHKVDTNGNGIDDFTEVIINHTDPLAGGAALNASGIIARLDVPGGANAVALAASPSNPSQLLAYVAAGTQGLAVVDVARPTKPTILGQVSLGGGTAEDVAVDTSSRLAAVTIDTHRLAILNVANPSQPALQQIIDLPVIAGGKAARRVQVANGIAYVTDGSALVAVDLASGAILQTLDTGTGLTGLAREDSTLYTMDTLDTLRIFDFSSGTLVPRGTVNLPQGGGQIFVGNGIAYVAAADYTPGGFATVDVRDPDHPTLISGSQVIFPARAPKTAIVANGSGLGLVLGFGTGTNTGTLDVMNTTDPANTNAFLARFALPNSPQSEALAAGLGYVADGDGGLVVVNYQAFHPPGTGPSISITTTVNQVVEGSAFGVHANVTDDVPLRTLELLVNGQVVETSVSFPFNLSAVAPPLSGTSGTVTVQVRATDTGGHTSLSNAVTLNLLADTTPLQIVSTTPANGAKEPVLSFRQVQIAFSRPITAASVTSANFQVLDDQGHVVSPSQIQLMGKVVTLSYPQFIPGNYQLVLHAAAILDSGGNALGSADLVSAFSVQQFLTFTGALSGDMNDPQNWDQDRLPGPADDVVISGAPATGTPYLPASAGAWTIASLTATTGDLNLFAPLTVTGAFQMGGALDVEAPLTVGGNFAAGGSVLADAALTVGGGFHAGRSTVYSLLANAPITVGGNFQADGFVAVEAPLTVNGTSQEVKGELNFQTAVTVQVDAPLLVKGNALVGGDVFMNRDFTVDGTLAINGSFFSGTFGILHNATVIHVGAFYGVVHMPFPYLTDPGSDTHSIALDHVTLDVSFDGNDPYTVKTIRSTGGLTINGNVNRESMNINDGLTINGTLDNSFLNFLNFAADVSEYLPVSIWNMSPPPSHAQNLSGTATLTDCKLQSETMTATDPLTHLLGTATPPTALTIEPGITFRGHIDMFVADGSTIVNQGVLIADDPSDTSSRSLRNRIGFGEDLLGVPGEFTNQGELRVENGVTFEILNFTSPPGLDPTGQRTPGTFRNNGTFHITGGATLEILSGTAWSSPRTTVDAGSRAYLDGVLVTDPDHVSILDGAGQWLAWHGQLVAGAHGLIDYGCQFQGGTVLLTGGALLHGACGFDGATFQGDIVVDQDQPPADDGPAVGLVRNGLLVANIGPVTVRNSLTFNGNLTLGSADGSYAGILAFEGDNQTLAGQAVVHFGPNVNNELGTVEIGTVPNLSIGANVTLTGAHVAIGPLDDLLFPAPFGNTGSITNHGTITSTGGSITLGGPFPFVNRVTWFNPDGHIVGASGVSIYLGAIFATADALSIQPNGSAVFIIGLMHNEGTALMLDHRTGSWLLDGGDISGGTVVTFDGNALVLMNAGVGLHNLPNGALENVTVAGTLATQDAASGATGFVFTLTGTLDLGNGGTFAAFNRNGLDPTIHDYTQSASGVLTVGLLGASTSGQVNVVDVAQLDGTLNVKLAPTYVPNLGDSFKVMTYGSRVGQFAAVAGVDLGNGLALQVQYNAQDVTLIVVSNHTNTALSGAPVPPVIGQTETLTASVTALVPGAGTPSGNVVFRDGTNVLGTVALKPDGTASIGVLFTATAHHFVAQYTDPQGNFVGSTSAVLDQGPSAVALTGPSDPLVGTQPVTFIASVADVAGTLSGGRLPAGKVAFLDGTTTLATIDLDATGNATWNTALSAGSHSITAVYGGSTTFAGSSSAVVSHTVGQAMSTTTLSSSPNPSGPNGSVTFQAVVSPVAPAAQYPTGTVTFMEGSTTLGTGQLFGGVATFTTSSLTVGNHTITAIYAGDSNFTGSTSASITQVVSALNQAVIVASALGQFPQPVTVQVQVQSSTGGPVPTGMVSVIDPQTGSTLQTAQLDKTGVATLVANLSFPELSLLVTYAGDSNYNSTSTIVRLGISVGP